MPDLHPRTPTGNARSTPTLFRPVLIPAAVLCLGAGVICAAPAPVQAQQVAPPAVVRLDLPSQPLASTINALAQAFGQAISADGALLEGRTAPTVRGAFTLSQALQRAMTDSGLTALQAGSVWTVQRGPQSAVTLSPVTVRASALDGTTEGSQSYTQTGPTATATGLNLSLRETPQSVTVMTRQRMDDFKLETLSEVLAQTPGVTVNQQADNQIFTVRGSNVNLQTDGNRQFADGWGWNSHITHKMDDMAEIDRIEVLKGSSGLINGDGAYGATVNLIRKRPTPTWHTTVSADAGSWGRRRADADVSGPLNADGSLRGRLVAGHRQGGLFRDHAESRSTLIYGTLEYDLARHTLLSAGLTWRDRKYSGAAGTTPIQGFDGDGRFIGWTPRQFNTGATWSGHEQDSLNAFARVEHRFANGWTGKLNIAHERIDTPTMNIALLWYGQPPWADLARYKDLASANQSVGLDLQGPVQVLGREHELLVGVGASRSRTTLIRGVADNIFLPGATYFQGGSVIPDGLTITESSNDFFSRRRSYAYAAARINPADRVKIITGVRATNYQQRDVTDVGWYNNDLRERGVITPYAGVVLDVMRDVSVYGSYASIFQAQGNKDVNQVTLPPEEGNTYELGAKGEFFEQRLNVSAAHFWMRTDNTPEEIGLTPAGDSIYRAVHGVRRRGYELEMSGQLALGWQAQGSFVMNSSTLDSAGNAPRHQFKFGTTYRVGNGMLSGLTVGGSARWQSGISVARAGAVLVQDPYWVFDAMARYEVNRQLSLSANVNNLFDKRYFAGVTNFNADGLFYTWGAPRSVIVGARYTF